MDSLYWRISTEQSSLGCQAGEGDLRPSLVRPTGPVVNDALVLKGKPAAHLGVGLAFPVLTPDHGKLDLVLVENGLEFSACALTKLVNQQAHNQVRAAGARYELIVGRRTWQDLVRRGPIDQPQSEP